VRSAAPFLIAFSISSPAAAAAAVDAERLVAALMGSTPLVEDLRSLTDEIGGRPTGSAANERSIEWGLARFRAMGVDARRESFPMPARWLERSARATVRGPVSFSPAVAAMPFSMTTAGTTARLLDAGKGTEADFARLGSSVRGAFLLVETEELADLDGLFREYAEAAGAEKRAAAADAAGVVYMGSRPRNLLYRHTAARGAKNDRLLLIMEREGAQRALRLVRAGRALDLAVEIDAERGGGYESANVVGEIRGTEKPEEIVLLGAHLDSWDLGTGALDNGCNVTLVLDVARQVKTLGLRPRRTLRFVLWNGEEQGLVGSLGYVKRHAAELDRHVATVTLDIGSGRLTGFFTGGRPELEPVLTRVLKPVEGLGPFVHSNDPIVGTDNYDFMIEGVANLVANQDSANYGPNYHARSDTFDKVDQRQLRLNAAAAAAVVWGLAEGDVTWRRQTAAEVEALVNGTSLKDQMTSFDLWESWTDGSRRRKP
jgi:carboxypeptidase Q